MYKYRHRVLVCGRINFNTTPLLVYPDIVRYVSLKIVSMSEGGESKTRLSLLHLNSLVRSGCKSTIIDFLFWYIVCLLGSISFFPRNAHNTQQCPRENQNENEKEKVGPLVNNTMGHELGPPLLFCDFGKTKTKEVVKMDQTDQNAY